jgi:cytochrome P450
MTRPLRRWPLLGHLPSFQADSTAFLLQLSREQGDVAHFRLGRTDAVLLSHPQDVRRVLVDMAPEFTKGRLMQRARRLLGDGLLTSEGEMHRCQRRSIQPVFAKERLHGYAELVPALARSQVSRWRPGHRIHLNAEMEALTMTVVARTMLGDIQADVPALGAALRRLARWAPLLAAPGGEIWENVRLPLLGSLGDAIQTVETVIDRQLEERSAAGALVQTLRDGNGVPMSARLVRDEVMTIFLAGHDTTAAALTWIWLLLGEHDDVAVRMREELSSVLQGRLPDVSDLPKLGYTGSVVKEALRLYPPIGRIGRRPVRDIDLEPPVIRKDTAVFLSPFVTQRDSRWFPDPDLFRPERWSEPAPDRPRFAWFPFGAGPRSCIGEQFAMMMLTLSIATIAQQWRLRPVKQGLPRGRSLLTLKPRGSVWMIPSA